MSVNKAILVGNVGKDPEVRYLDNGTVVASITLATTKRGYTLANGTKVPERTTWHNIVAWRGLAEIAEKYIKKGSQLYIEGEILNRSYEKDGITRWVTEIVAENIELLGRKPESGTSAHTVVENTVTSSEPSRAAQQSSFGDNGGEDDLPF